MITAAFGEGRREDERKAGARSLPAMEAAAQPDFTLNEGVRMPTRAELEEIQLAEMLVEPAGLSKPVPETQEEVDVLLDSNYAIITQLVRLRYTREAGQPRAVERTLMAMLERNLGKLAACQSPSAVISPQTAQAARAMMRQGKEAELSHQSSSAVAAHQQAPASAQEHQAQMMQRAMQNAATGSQAGGVQASAMQQHPNHSGT